MPTRNLSDEEREAIGSWCHAEMCADALIATQRAQEDTGILDEKQIAEIEAREVAASRGPWSQSALANAYIVGPIHEDFPVICALAEYKNDGTLHLEFSNAENNMAFVAHAREDIPALCQTVRALRSMVYVPKILPDDDEITYQQQAERLLGEKVELQSRLAQVEQERGDALRELRAIEADALNVLVAAERHAITDFRTRAIQLCRDKAAEWEGRTDQSMSSYALKIADQLEKL